MEWMCTELGMVVCALGHVCVVLGNPPALRGRSGVASGVCRYMFSEKSMDFKGTNTKGYRLIEPA